MQCFADFLLKYQEKYGLIVIPSNQRNAEFLHVSSVFDSEATLKFTLAVCHSVRNDIGEM